MSLEALQYWLSQDHIFIYDSTATRSYRQLRALPAMSYLGYEVFTYPKSWSQLSGTELYTLYEHDHTNINNIQVIEEPTCVITNQNHEEYTPNSIAKLRNMRREPNGRLAIYADEKDFQIQGAKRPLRDQHKVVTRSYQEIYDTFDKHYADGGFLLPLSDTQNLFLQDNAILYQQVNGRRLNSSEKLFEVVREAPYLPLYGSLCRIFNRDESFGASPLSAGEIDEFGGWLRRRVEWDNKTANRVAEILNKQVLEDQNTFAQATRVGHPTVADAKAAVKRLDSDSHSLASRLQRWVQQVGP